MGDPSTTPSGAVSSGALRTKISIKFGGESLGAYQVLPPFYAMKSELPPESSLLGSNDLLNTFDLSNQYQRFVGGPKRMREDLGSFLPNLYGNFNVTQAQDFSSLKRLVEKPPITGKEIIPLNASGLSGFRLNPGPVDERYRNVFENRRDMQIPGTSGYDENPAKKYKKPLVPLNEDEDVQTRKADQARRHEKKKRKKEKKKKDKEAKEGLEGGKAVGLAEAMMDQL